MPIQRKQPGMLGVFLLFADLSSDGESLSASVWVTKIVNWSYAKESFSYQSSLGEIIFIWIVSHFEF